jgi:hypothetical protein
MAYWPHHKLADAANPTVALKVGKHCVAVVDLPGVPAGTRGRVILANGFEWPRYRVLFDNGVETGNLDARHLAPPE